MKPQYAAWIAANVPTYETAFGRCHAVTEYMVKDFPELQRVYGIYHCPIWGDRWHRWCVTPEGEIVDPTAKQFPSLGQFAYEPITDEAKMPVGKCANCGEYIYVYYDGTVCSDACGKEFVASLYAQVRS